MNDEKNNSGDRNSGYWNSGDRNSGDGNSGNWNSGNLNSGNWNSGDRNSGDWNSGNLNSGDRNSGDWNSGNLNSGDRNSGYLNTDSPKVRIFNKETDLDVGDIVFPNFFRFNLTEWVDARDMSDAEKAEHPFWENTGGYLKTYEYKEAWRNAWDKADEEDRAKLFDLPNFDADIFFEISGIDVREKEEVKTINVCGVEYAVDDVEKALAGLKPITKEVIKDE